MGGMGPPPKPADQRRRRNAPTFATVRLPPGGRHGDPPVWPLPRSTKAEKELWADLWATPQAVAWESLGWERVVARYTRTVLKAEREMTGALLADARQMEDRLGLTPLAMLRLRWEIAPDEIGELREEKTPRVRLVEAVDPVVEGRS
jgi:hypothetical protein